MSEAGLSDLEVFDLVVVGAGPAGLFAALRGAELGARTALLSSGAIGGLAANDGPVPVRTLAHAARLVRDARQLGRYGIAGCEPLLDYPLLLRRVDEVVGDVNRDSALRPQLENAGVTIIENAGHARFLGSHRLALPDGRRFEAHRIILCTGAGTRRPPIPGIELTATHSDAWGLRAVPESILVVGGGATGMQVASVFNAFGSRVDLFESKSSILSSEDEDFADAVARGFHDRGIAIHCGFGTIDRFEAVTDGVAMHFTKGGRHKVATASLVVAAMGAVAETRHLDLAEAGVETDARGFVAVDEMMRTTAPNIYAAGDVTGRMMLAPQAIHQGVVAATNAFAVSPAAIPPDRISPTGSFTDPEYAQVGMTENEAKIAVEVVVTVERFASVTRAIIDGRTEGFCKLIAARGSGTILGCHVVGDRAIDIVHIATVAMASGMTVREFARVPFAFPTYASALARASLALVKIMNDDRVEYPVMYHRPNAL